MKQTIMKLTSIVALFLGNKENAAELHRSALKFLRVVITCLDDASLEQTMNIEIISSIFALRKRKRYLVQIRQLTEKLINRFGVEKLKSMIPLVHHKLIAYIERVKRKKQRAWRKEHLLDLLGEEQQRLKEENESDDEEDDDDSSGDDEDDDQEAKMDEEEGDLSEADDSDEEEFKKTEFDTLHADAIDIPRVSKLKVISTQKKEDKPVAKKKSKKEMVTEVMEADQDKLETHFIENPFIKIRERTNQKQLGG